MPRVTAMTSKTCEGFGWDVPEKPAFNWATLIAHKDREIARLNGIYGSLLRDSGVEVIEGFARFVDARSRWWSTPALLTAAPATEADGSAQRSS